MSRVSLALAWLGGALFVAALLYFLYFYFVLLGRPAGDGDWRTALAVNVLLFGAFGLHHSVMARPGAKRWFASVAPAALERSAFVWVSSALLILVCTAWQPVPGLLYSVSGGWSWVLRVVQFGGIALTLRASGQLDVLDLAGVRQVQEARGERARAPRGLLMRGPFTFVRHPVYLGWVLIVFAAPHMTANRLAFAAISTAYLAIAVLFEERSLEHAFGANYREYKQRVRWRFLPGLY